MGFKQSEVANYIGRGITLPLQLVNGRVPLKSGFELIRDSIRNILCWPYATRFFLTEFGSRLEELIEEPNDDVLFNLIETFVIDTITQWEKRVDQVEVFCERTNDNKLVARVYYRIISEQKHDSLIYPFYSPNETTT